MNFLTIWISLLIQSAFHWPVKCEISPEDKKIIRKWMPLYWLHPEEVFNPINFDYYISHMQLKDSDGNIVDEAPTAETIPIGTESQNLHLNTIKDLDCVHCFDEVLFGQPVDQVGTIQCK